VRDPILLAGVWREEAEEEVDRVLVEMSPRRPLAKAVLIEPLKKDINGQDEF